MMPRERPRGDAIPEGVGMSSSGSNDEAKATRTLALLRSLEDRVAALEQKVSGLTTRRRASGCVALPNGDVFVQGSGWIRRVQTGSARAWSEEQD
jgi:hypothetical protein